MKQKMKYATLFNATNVEIEMGESAEYISKTATKMAMWRKNQTRLQNEF